MVLLIRKGTTEHPEIVPITLNSISIAKGVRKVIHQAVHAIGIPHDEPAEEAEESTPASNVQSGKDARPDEAGGSGAENEMSRYLAEIRSRIASTQRYPREARMNDQQGVVGLKIAIAPDGSVLRVEVETPSVFPSLNEAALAAARAHPKFPELPRESGSSAAPKPVTLHVPIHFVLSP
ncbi:MAG: TonB family protein [Proteobacteria bacterium]|nr:TonB family protein [Pseudomonadota bacterium]